MPLQHSNGSTSAKKLNVTDPPIITVIGKAFWDIGHAPKDQSNRRKYMPGFVAALNR
jgi:hypothetical protein